jgi:hypothetical protein
MAPHAKQLVAEHTRTNVPSVTNPLVCSRGRLYDTTDQCPSPRLTHPTGHFQHTSLLGRFAWCDRNNRKRISSLPSRSPNTLLDRQLCPTSLTPGAPRRGVVRWALCLGHKSSARLLVEVSLVRSWGGRVLDPRESGQELFKPGIPEPILLATGAGLKEKRSRLAS